MRGVAALLLLAGCAADDSSAFTLAIDIALPDDFYTEGTIELDGVPPAPMNPVHFELVGASAADLAVERHILTISDGPSGPALVTPAKPMFCGLEPDLVREEQQFGWLGGALQPGCVNCLGGEGDGSGFCAAPP